MHPLKIGRLFGSCKILPYKDNILKIFCTGKRRLSKFIVYGENLPNVLNVGRLFHGYLIRKRPYIGLLCEESLLQSINSEKTFDRCSMRKYFLLTFVMGNIFHNISVWEKENLAEVFCMEKTFQRSSIK